AVPTASSQPETIVTGPDGNLWFTESAKDNIGQITPAGVITEFPVPRTGTTPDGVTLGPDNNLWFTSFSGQSVGRLVPTYSNVVVTTPQPVLKTTTANVGTTVVWTFVAPTNRGIVDTSGMGLFASGTKTIGSTYAFRFVAAGTYAYK